MNLRAQLHGAFLSPLRLLVNGFYLSDLQKLNYMFFVPFKYATIS